MAGDGETAEEGYQNLKREFAKHEAQSVRFAKELAKYHKALDAICTASKSLGDCVRTIYEPEFGEAGSFEAMEGFLTDQEQAHSTFLQQLNDTVIVPMASYNQTFALQQKRLDKRDRRQLDHDRTKRAMDSANQKGKNVEKATAEFQAADKNFTDINAEINETIPAFNQNRKTFFGTTFQSMYDAFHIYHATSAAKSEKLSGVMEGLCDSTASSRDAGAAVITDRAVSGNVLEQAARDVAEDDAAAAAEAKRAATAIAEMTIQTPETAVEQPAPRPRTDVDESSVHTLPPPTPRPRVEPSGEAASAEAQEPPAELGIVIERRVATHNYTGQDDDELSFTAGDRIFTLPFSDPEDEDEGWCNGTCMRGQKWVVGVFPANFTQLL